MTLTIFRATGQVSGTFTAGGLTYDINSVILQSTNVARLLRPSEWGWFVHPLLRRDDDLVRHPEFELSSDSGCSLVR